MNVIGLNLEIRGFYRGENFPGLKGKCPMLVCQGRMRGLAMSAWMILVRQVVYWPDVVMGFWEMLLSWD